MDPQFIRRVYWQLFEKIVFLSLLAAILNFCVKRKNQLISEMERDRAISTKFLTVILNFCTKCKSAFISETVRDRAISTIKIFDPQGILTTLCNFQKHFLTPKMAAILNFLPKMQKHKFASICLSMRDRAISLKFSTQRVSYQTTLCNFQKNFLSPKMAAILNLQIFAKKCKKHRFASCSLTVQDRAILSKFQPTGYLSNVLLAIFHKNGAESRKIQLICFYLLNHAR